ncbi:MAG: SDR family NAD(P)-dependent oxidoreductase [Pyrinomonadaceae bacterium]
MKVALITGASGGIGEAFARRLAADGRDLLLVARSEKQLHELCDELMLKHKITAHYMPLDLTEPGAIDRLVGETEKHNLEVDWLVNNAGYGSMGDFVELDLETELRMIDLNISALVTLTHRFLGPMRERRSGTIVNVASTASFQPIPFMATYAATKAFVTSFSQAVAEENRPFGILVTALCPGPTKTNFFRAAKITDPIQLKGMQTAEEVVDVAMRAVAARRPLAISGLTNYIGAVLGRYVPTRLVTRVVASQLRKKYQQER